MTSQRHVRCVAGQEMRIGQDFQALHFTENAFKGAIDPILMVDHFHMTAPTFEPHPHAGISAVTYVFEDSSAPHVNHDSLGNHQAIHPGGLHWFVAGRGAIHTEQPEGPAPHVHALQIFVNLPSIKKWTAPKVLHLEPTEIPEYSSEGARVRVVLGESEGVRQAATAFLPEPFAMFDVFLSPSASFTYRLQPGWSAMVIMVEGELTTSCGDEAIDVDSRKAVGIGASSEDSSSTMDQLRLTTDVGAHFVLLSGQALREPIAWQGPFVMNTDSQLRQVIDDYHAGRLGVLSMPASR